jgi:hypothetical protein
MGQRARLAGILLVFFPATALSVRAQPPRVYRVGIIQHGGSYLRAARRSGHRVIRPLRLTEVVTTDLEVW